MEEFIRRAGLQDSIAGTKPKYIHITGTNGKGSTTAFTQSMLVQSGYRTGGYFSPYVYDLRERIQINGSLIEKTLFTSLVQRLAPIAESFDETEFGGVSEFEFKTALGFMAWQETQCEWVALEVGIGGLLDSTNVVESACSIIVSVGMDHTDLLGSTHAEIATQKAGIIKPGKPALIGHLSAEAEAVVQEICRQKGSELWRLGREITVVPGNEGWSVAVPGHLITGLHPGLKGSYQIGNMALAIAAMFASGAYVSDDAIRNGATQTRLPGRFEHRTILGRQCILDGAHNGESAQTLVNSIREEYPNRQVVLLTAMLAGHDPERFYRAFDGLARDVLATEVAFYRRVPASDLAERIRVVLPNVEAIADNREALAQAVNRTSPDDLLVITGSFYLLGDLRQALDELEKSASLRNEA